MPSLSTFKSQLERLEERRSLLLRSGKMMQAFALDSEIKNVRENIKHAEEYLEATKPRPVAELMTKQEINESGIIPLIIECHLISDMLVEVAYMVVDRCKELGFEKISFMKDLTDAIKANEKFATFLTQLQEDTDNEICNLLIRNETLNKALHKKYVSYMNQRLTNKTKI